MKSKPKRCRTCGKVVSYPTLGWANHMAMHERELLRNLEFASASPGARGKSAGEKPTRPKRGNDAGGREL